MNAGKVNPPTAQTGSSARTKTETLSLRLDPKAKFMLDFMARVNGQSITTAVERAIQEAANQVMIGTNKNWTNYWDIDEGVRSVRLLGDRDYPKSFAEDELLSFINDHWEFFYHTIDRREVRRYYVEILWPHRETFLDIWRAQRQTNYWAAGEQMKAKLAAAGLEPPEWPRPPVRKATKPNQPKESFSGDLDDEIPF